MKTDKAKSPFIPSNSDDYGDDDIPKIDLPQSSDVISDEVSREEKSSKGAVK